MITVPLDGSAADTAAGNRHKETKAKKKSERMELLGRSRTCKRPEDGCRDMKSRFIYRQVSFSY
jgi:hypothetical protein